MADSSSVDSVPLEAPPTHAAHGALPGRSGVKRFASIKILIAIFLIFVVIVSDMFVENVLSGFGDKAVRGRSPTAWGTVLQGTFLVIFYILALALVEHKVL